MDIGEGCDTIYNKEPLSIVCCTATEFVTVKVLLAHHNVAIGDINVINDGLFKITLKELTIDKCAKVKHNNSFKYKVCEDLFIKFNSLTTYNYIPDIEVMKRVHAVENNEHEHQKDNNVGPAITSYRIGLKESLVFSTDDLTSYKFTKHDHAIMKMCYDLADMSTCKRAQMGAIIAIDEAVFVTGYNGTVKKFPNNCDDVSHVCDVCNIAVDSNLYKEGEKHCKTGYVTIRPKSNLSVIHAETNAILRAAKLGIAIQGKTMYMTTSPCVTCANNIVQAGITRIVYAEEHDDLRGLDILKQAGVEIIKYIKPDSCSKEVSEIKDTENIQYHIDDLEEATHKCPVLDSKALEKYIKDCHKS